jgi:Rrf2 family protein
MAKQPRGVVVYKRDICAAEDVTPAFLTKILQPLIKCGIVASQRGVGGGFYLAKDPSEITLFDIIASQEGPLYINQCLIDKDSCARQTSCPVHGVWAEIRENFSSILRNYTFAELIRREEAGEF